jgi:hypothetical protein
MRKVLFSISLVSSTFLSAATIIQELNQGWNLVGAIEDINPADISCVEVLWMYSDNQWSLYIPQAPSNNYGYSQITKINKADGFWIKSDSNDCNLTYNTPDEPSVISFLGIVESVNYGENISISVDINKTDASILSHSWKLNGTEISTSSNLDFLPNKAGDHNITVDILFSDGVKSTNGTTIKVKQPYYSCVQNINGAPISGTDTLSFNDNFDNFNHSQNFEQLAQDYPAIAQDYYYDSGMLWYSANMHNVMYSGYLDLYKRYSGYLPTGKNLTILQAESDHTPENLGLNIHELFEDMNSSSHSDTVATILSQLDTYPMLYTQYSTFSPDLTNFHTATTPNLRDFFANDLSSSNSYPLTDFQGNNIESAKLLNISNTNGGSDLELLNQFDKFVRDNDMISCTAMSSLKAGNWTTSGMSYNSIVVQQYYYEKSALEGPKVNAHGEGRQKPDIMAHSNVPFASSYSTPQTCSAIAMMLERATIDSSLSSALNSTVIKAIMMTGATRFNYNATLPWDDNNTSAPAQAQLSASRNEWERISDSKPLDPAIGSGVMNINTSYTILSAGEQKASDTIVHNSTGWDYQTNTEENITYKYLLDIQQLSRLSSVLVWHRYIDDDFVSYMPDYQLRLLDGNGVLLMTSDSKSGNVELVTIDVEPGQYRLEVQMLDDNNSTDLSYAIAWHTKKLTPKAMCTQIEDEFKFSIDSDQSVSNYKYRVQVSEDANFSSLIEDTYIDNTQYTHSSYNKDGDPYYLRVFSYPKDSDVAFMYPIKKPASKAPVIRLNAASTSTVTVGDSYTDDGAYYIDSTGGYIDIESDITVDTNTIGTYILTYKHIDSNGNVATPVKRIVNVVGN